MKISGNKLGGKRRHKQAIAAVALGALVSFQAGAAKADDTAAEIRLLKARLKHLEERVAEQGRKEKETQAQIRHAAAQPGPPPGPAPYAYPIGIGLPPQPPIGNSLAERLAKIKGYPYVGATSLYLGGMSITPGGFLELASVTRSAFIGADIATPFGNIPFANVPSSHTHEFRFSARRSRLSLLAGQAWTLATMNVVGIVPRTEYTPLVIDDQYVPGFTWARQPQIRVTKDFDQTLWFALSAENPQTTFGGTTPTLIDSGAIISTVGATGATFPQTSIVGGSLFNNGNAISLNQAPDIIGKVAWDPTPSTRMAASRRSRKPCFSLG
jgi:hypothetical protein